MLGVCRLEKKRKKKKQWHILPFLFQTTSSEHIKIFGLKRWFSHAFEELWDKGFKRQGYHKNSNKPDI